MPVSRKRKPRKNKRKKDRRQRPAVGPSPFESTSDADASTLATLPGVLEALGREGRRREERRRSLATSAAAELITELADITPDIDDAELADELCRRCGEHLATWADGPSDSDVSPDGFIVAVVQVACARVEEALAESTAADGWQGPWRILAAVAGIVPSWLGEPVDDAVRQLREHPGGQHLPALPKGPRVTGEVVWTRDAYGSRFGIAAPVSTPQRPNRWYLWDVDACGFRPFTVHSAYYPTAEAALSAWRAGVGDVAGGGSSFSPVDDPGLLAELLPTHEGIFRTGCENGEQFAEYHRARRLAEAVMRGLRRGRATTPVDPEAEAPTEFLRWLETQRGDLHPDADELVRELVESWQIEVPAALFYCCSPHRMACAVLHIRNYYQDDFAAELIELLPDWMRWLATRSGLSPELVERCQPYATGHVHPDVGDDDTKPRYLARVVE
ncbi:MAG: hypothetical protein GEV04_21370 [Actinophytocola sp.]|nr:hypothetical protein [Actinophytocola sp.]